MIDTLTNIPTIVSLNETLEKASSPKLFLIDIKNFKDINIKHSDEAGNFVLISFALALENFAQKNNMLCFRVQDDEFAIFKDMPFDLKIIEKILFDLVDFINAQKYEYQGNLINVQAHMGICLDHNHVLRKAKSALDLAQKEDQPFVTYSDFANRMLEESEEEISEALRESIQNGTTNPYFQRVIDLEGNTIYNETLLRIMNKDSLQSPKLFLTIARNRGFYPAIMKILIEKVLGMSGRISINLAYKDVFDEDLLNFLILNLKNTDSILELQKEGYICDAPLIERLKYIKTQGIKICIDNVKKASSLDFFDKESVDFVKVDGNLIRLLGINETSECEAILLACNTLCAKTIATHINSNASFDEAKKLGFDYYQGFFFGKPSLEFN